MSEEMAPMTVPGAPDTPMTFRSSLFGFNRKEVLGCIDALAAKAQEDQRLHEERLAQLQGELETERRESTERAVRADEELRVLQTQMEETTARAENAEEQVQDLSRKLLKANEQTESFKSRLFAKEQEAMALQSSNRSLSELVDQQKQELEDTRKDWEARLTRQKEAARAEAEAARKTWEEELEAERRQAARKEAELTAEADAARQEAADGQAQLAAQLQESERRIAGHKEEVRRSMLASAQQIELSMEAVRRQLEDAQKKIDEATAQWQAAAGTVSAALEKTEEGMKELGVELKKLPPEDPEPVWEEEPQPEEEPIDEMADPALRRAVVRNAVKAECRAMADGLLKTLTKLLGEPKDN